MAVEDLGYRDYWLILRRRWRLPFLGAVLGGVLGLAAAKLQTPQPIYEALAFIRYDPLRAYELPGREIASGDPISTQLVFIRSAVVLGNLARRLGRIPEDTPPDALDRHAEVLAKLNERIEVITDPRQRTGVMLIRARAKTPEDAVALANQLVAAYQEENIHELKKDIVQRREFLESQIAVNESNINDAQLELEKFRREHPEVAVDAATQGTINTAAKTEAVAQELAVKIDETRRQLDLVRDGRPPSDIGLQMIVGATGTSRLQQLSANYTRLSLDRGHLLTEFTEFHPTVIQKEEQIESLRGEIEGELVLILDAFRARQEEELARLEEMKAEQESLPRDAMQLAQLARKVKVYENIQLQLRGQLEDALIKEAGVIGQVSVVSPATPPTHPMNRPSFLRFGGLGLAAGFFGGFVIAVLLESARFSLRTLREIEEALDLPVLGIASEVSAEQLSGWTPDGRILRRDTDEWRRTLGLAPLLAPRSPIGETFRTLRANLQPRLDTGARAFTLTATTLGEGTTTTLLNLALSFAQSGQRVLLVESDFRNPAISSTLGLQPEPGLAEVLLGSLDLESATRSVADFVTGKLSLDELLLGPGIDNLNVLPCGDLSGGTGELLSSEAFGRVLAEIQKSYDVALFDSPPLSAAADTIALGRLTGVVVVFDPHRTDRAGLEDTVTHLRNAECRIVGLFVNGLEAEATEEAERGEIELRAAL